MSMDGAEVLILVNTGTEEEPEWEAVAQQTGWDDDSEANMIDASHKTDPHSKWLYGKHNGTGTLEALWVPDDDAKQKLRQAQRDRETVIIRRQEQGEAVEEVEALIQTMSRSFPDNDVSTYTVEFQFNDFWEEVSNGAA